MPKRARKFEWCVSFAVPSSFLSVIKAVSYVSETVYLVVANDSVSTQAVSSAKSCVVMGHVSTSSTMGLGDGERKVCTSAKTMLKAVSSANGSQTITIGQVDDDHVVVDICSDQGVREMTWKIPLIATDQFAFEMDGMSYQNEWIYDTATLRTDIKRCRSVESGDKILLQLYADEASTASSVSLSAQGSLGEVEIHHRSRVREEESHAMVDVSEDDASGGGYSDLNPVFSQTYDVAPLADFLRCVDAACVRLRMGQQQPLLVELQLPPENSGFMKFAQAPCV